MQCFLFQVKPKLFFNNFINKGDITGKFFTDLAYFEYNAMTSCNVLKM